ncbi:MAG TPA: alpha/beta fold hydrolase [Rhodoferax sp.]
MVSTLQVGDLTVHVEGQGAQTVVMVHGWPDTQALWDPQVAALRDRFRCVRFTLPGFDQGHPRRVYQIEEVVAQLRAVLDAVSPDQPVVLLLHDWGCIFGYALARKHPERVRAVIGIDVGDAGSPEHVATLGIKPKLMMVTYQLWLALAWNLGGTVGNWMTRRMAALLHAPGAPASIGSWMNYPYHVQWTRGYPRKPFMPTAPMLFVYGTRKPFMFHSQAWTDDLAARPGNAVHALRAGHWVSRNAAAEFNALTLAWLDSLVG